MSSSQYSDSEPDYSHSFEEQESEEPEAQIKDEQQMIKEQLKEIPYGEILRHQQSNKNKINNQRQKKAKKFKKHLLNAGQVDKNAPKEIKIMKMPPKQKIKPVFESQKSARIDPRFEDYAGEYNADLAAKSYSFITEKQKIQVEELKNKIQNKKTKQAERDILLKNYNQITSDMKRYQISQIQKQVKAKYRKQEFNPKKKELKQEIERVKLANMTDKDQNKRLKKKQKKIQKQRINQRKRLIPQTRPT